MIQKLKSLVIKFLIKTQKFTGSDNVYIAEQSAYLTIGSIVGIFIAFGLSFAFAHLLSKETYGQYKYIISIVELLSISSLLGINTAVVRGVARGFEGTLKQGFKTKSKWGLIGSIASIAVAIYFWIQGQTVFAVSFLIVTVFVSLFKSGEIYQFYLSGKKLFNKRTFYNTLTQFLASAAIVLTLLFTRNLIILILVYFFSYTALRLFFFYWVIKKFKPNSTEDEETIRYGKHLSLMGVIGLISQQLDKILLFYFVGPVNLAIYSFAVLPVEHLRTPFVNLTQIALPKFSVRPEEEIRKTLPKKLLKAVLLIVPIIIIYVVLAPYFYKMFFPQYVDSVRYSQLFSLVLLGFPATMMSFAIRAKMMTKELYKLNVINPLIQIILLVILTPLYGLLGAILARLLCEVCQFITVGFYFRKMK